MLTTAEAIVLLEACRVINGVRDREHANGLRDREHFDQATEKARRGITDTFAYLKVYERDEYAGKALDDYCEGTRPSEPLTDALATFFAIARKHGMPSFVLPVDLHFPGGDTE